VVSRQTGIFASGSLDLDSSARSFAIIQFRDAAIRENILEEANVNAQTAIEEFLKLVEPENMRIEVVTLPPDPSSPFPETCI
jgi:hypothetical protein